MMIPLAQIDFLPTGLRGDPEPDEAFIESIRTLGVLQPVLLRPAGNRYEAVKGERRVRAARAAGLEEIPAHVEAALVGPHATVARLAATMARRPLSTTEQWRALCTLTDQGYDLAAAAVNVGIEPRTARQMERLGRLHPDLLAEYERIEASDDPEERFYGLPAWGDLGDIAAADPDRQIAAARACGLGGSLDWQDLAEALRRDRRHIPRGWAIFPHDRVAWTEDLFAEPGSADQFTCAAVQAFLDAQTMELTRLVAASRGRILAGDGWGWHRPVAGWFVDMWATGKPRAPEKSDPRVAIAWVVKKGPATGQVQWALAKPAKAAAGGAAAAPPDHTAGAGPAGEPHDEEPHDEEPPGEAREDDDQDRAEDEEAAPAPAAPEAKLPLTKAGQALLAKARTEALRAALRDPDRRYSYDDLLSLLVIALSAGTVHVRSSHHSYAHKVDLRDLAARLIDGDGALRDDADPGRVAQEALARMLCLPEPDEIGGYNQSGADSARVPLAIGAIVGADAHLPRLDTEAFLAQVAGAELKAWAKAEGVKLSKVGEIRSRMQDRAEGWRPAWARFDTAGEGAQP